MSTDAERAGRSRGADGLLAGKRVLVTGGSSGIGRGICAVAAREGARVAFVYGGNAEGARETVRRIEDAGGEALPMACDLREARVPAELVARVDEAWGGIDVLVNNAAVSEAVPFVLIDDDDLMDLLAVNFVAPFRLCREAARGMVRRKWGRIVNISSIAGSRAVPGPTHYAASKGALEGLTRSLAHELGPYGVLVNAIAAGIFEGGLRSTIPEHHQRRYVEACALSRVGRPAECGELVAWLASERNTYLNGEVVILDGGTVT